MKFCPKCATRNADDASVCRNAACGHRFATAGGAAAASGGSDRTRGTSHPSSAASHAPAKGTNVNPAARRYCCKCGSPNDGAATTCRCCGAALKPFAPSPTPQPFPPPPHPIIVIWRRGVRAVNAWHPGLKTAAVLAVCLGLGALSQMGGENASRSTEDYRVAKTTPTHVNGGAMPMGGVCANGSPSDFYMEALIAPFANVLATPVACVNPSNSGGDIHQRALQIVWNSCGRAMTDSELAIVEQSIREGRGTRKQKEEEIQNLRSMNANIRMQNSYWDMQHLSAASALADARAANAKLDSEIALQDTQNDMHTRSLARIDGVSVDQYNTGGSLGITSWDGSQNGSRIGHTLGGDIFKVDQDGTAYRFDNGNWYRQ